MVAPTLYRVPGMQEPAIGQWPLVFLGEQHQQGLNVLVALQLRYPLLLALLTQQNLRPCYLQEPWPGW